MDYIFQLIIVIIGGAIGLFTSAGIVVGMIVTILNKCYRKIKYNISMFD